MTFMKMNSNRPRLPKSWQDGPGGTDIVLQSIPPCLPALPDAEQPKGTDDGRGIALDLEKRKSLAKVIQFKGRDKMQKSQNPGQKGQCPVVQPSPRSFLGNTTVTLDSR